MFGGGSASSDGAKRGPKNGKASYDELKRALDDEQALLKLMLQLEPKEFDRLMEASEQYAIAYKSVYDAQREKEARMRQEQAAQLAMARSEKEGEIAMRLEEKRTQEDRARTEYQLKRVTEEQATRTQMKLEEKRKFEAMDAEKHRRDLERMERQHELDQKNREREFDRQQRAIAAKLEKKAQLARETEMALAKHRLADHKARHEVEKDHLLETARTEAQIRADASVATAKARYAAATTFFSGPEGRERMQNAALAVSLSAVGIYAARTVYPVAQRALTNYFFKPQLVARRVVHRSSGIGRAFQRIFSSDPAFSANASSGQRALAIQAAEAGRAPATAASAAAAAPSSSEVVTDAAARVAAGLGPHVVLPPALQDRMETVIRGARATTERGGYFGHMLLWGKPGTGKTLFAEKLAMESGMDFAVMSGPSFDQFHPKDAIVEIKELFKWANRGSKPVLLFVDEADSFLEDRSTLHPDRVRVLNEFINQTGTESRNFMLCYETNRPEVLDPAVQSRVTRAVEFPTPGRGEVSQMLRYYVEAYVAQQPVRTRGRFGWLARAVTGGGATKRVDTSAITHEAFEEYAQRLHEEGFVGRDISNLAIALSQEIFANNDLVLTPEIADTVIERQIAKKRQDIMFAVARADRLQNHFQRMEQADKE